MTRAKTIKMLLYDGNLSGVTNISDSAWESGKMYSAPRESIDQLVLNADCKKYGVYLLLSNKQVYVGQAMDLERRTRQHLADKDWWNQVILLTTKDNSFNASDIDYLESKLIALAVEAGVSDSDNKKKGNREKVDEFREAELNQYLDEALFLLEIVGVTVFKRELRTKRGTQGKSGTQAKESANNHITSTPSIEQSPALPALPSGDLKIGAFVYTTMQNLADSGFVFSEEEISEMCTPEWSKKVFHTIKPFMKRIVSEDTDIKSTDGRVRFKSTQYTFGLSKVFISKEWYEHQRKLFVDWYLSLV